MIRVSYKNFKLDRLKSDVKECIKNDFENSERLASKTLGIPHNTLRGITSRDTIRVESLVKVIVGFNLEFERYNLGDKVIEEAFFTNLADIESIGTVSENNSIYSIQYNHIFNSEPDTLAESIKALVCNITSKTGLTEEQALHWALNNFEKNL